ncbi:MAG: prepilin-type N-terminal cleavage/methylation domain-containing protein [Desulfobacterales bacterium]|nr:prepilin-type N-terminal cleavage/methylation domain-containing protein [Desulfobacterales bacterium]
MDLSLKSGFIDTHSKGFTLLELLVVIAIMSISLIMALPRLGPQIISTKLKATYSNTVAIINLARFRAVEAQVPQHIIIDMDQNTIGTGCSARGFSPIRKQFPNGVKISWVNGGGKMIQNRSHVLIVQPDGTCPTTRMQVETQNEEAVIFEITGANSQVQMR